MERKLASIQKVLELNPIPGADKIEVCTVLGWKCVVQKGEFKPGDVGVYFEIDSLLPDKPEFAFMADRKFRVKTISLKKQISQGLFIPLSKITYADLSSYKEGDDVTELLGIEKWDPPEESGPGANLGGRKSGNFPVFLRKTDETRIQTTKNFLSRHKGKKFYYTEKLDGTSSTFYYLVEDLYGRTAGKFGVCGRNFEFDYIEDKPNSYWETAKRYNLEEKMKALGLNLCIQCEMVGPGIQKNKYKLAEKKLYIFNAYNVKDQTFFNYEKTKEIAAKLEMETAPILGEFVLDHTVEQLVEMSRGKSVLNKDTLREGIVCRAIVDEVDEELGRLSFKVIQPEFLLKFDL
jgi:RNA ligase (TIGR02306 family)